MINFRERSCTNPPPGHGGADCPGSDREVVECGGSHCPVDGGWSEWSHYSHCSVTCGEGVKVGCRVRHCFADFRTLNISRQFRARVCNSPVPGYGGEDCEGQSRHTEPCHQVDCHGGGSWSEWAPFGNCSTSCGCGIKTRYVRTCTTDTTATQGKPTC